MELVGKAVAVRITGAALDHLLKSPHLIPQPSVVPEVWTVVGEVKGETPSLGIWLDLIGLIRPGSEGIWHEGGNVYLLRWEWILSAMILPERPKSLADVGFRFPTAS